MAKGLFVESSDDEDTFISAKREFRNKSYIEPNKHLVQFCNEEPPDLSETKPYTTEEVRLLLKKRKQCISH